MVDRPRGRNPLLARELGFQDVFRNTIFPFSYIFICEANKNIDQAKDVRRKPRNLRRLRWFLRKSKQNIIFLKLFYSLKAVEFRQTPVFHTFFLPKRERKYQRKRFRAAARTPRGHRSCSALSALEIRRRLQRCYCNTQNEALAPLMGRKAYVCGCSRSIPP